MTANGKLVLIDAYAQIYRGFYGIRNLTNTRGEPTNALFAMARFLLGVDQDRSTNLHTVDVLFTIALSMTVP